MIVTAGRGVGVGPLGGFVVSRICRRRLAVAVMVVGLAWLLAVGQARAALPANCVAGTASVSCSFAYTGAEQTFAVPSGATSVDVEAIGAAGETSIFGGAVGGRGAVVSGEVAVTGSSTLYVEVGGTPTAPASGCYPANPCTGGFNGGGGGGFYGPGGGGASDVRTHTRADTAATLASRLIVAAGGGGGGDNFVTCSPGGAGGDAGVTGGDGPSCGITGATGGGAGTSSAGGAGGVAAAGNGGSGSLGQGGESQASGGGGGGGLYGGGAGGENDSDESNFAGAGGGGGGSNLVPAGGSGEVTTDPASVVISYAVPMASITTPADGAVYALGQQVSSSFTCADVSGGPGISSCVDQNGNPSGSPVDTSTPGSHTFTVTATNADGLVGQQSVAYAVAKASQAIAFTSSPPSPAVFGGSYAPAATGGGSGNPVVFSVDSSSGAGVCSISSGTVSFTGAGTCVIDADQAGNADYDAAAQQQQSFTVVKASQAIAFTSSPPSPAVFGGSYAPAATGGGSGNPVVFSIDSSSGAGVCSISSGTVSFTGAGTCVIDADQAGNADYDAAAQQQQSFTVVKASQAIAFTSSPPSPAVFGGSYTPAATGGGSGNPVVFSIDSSSGAGVCSISSGTVSFTGAGTCVIDADQAGNADYDAAAQQQQSFTVVKASQAIAFTSSPPSPAVFGGSYTPAATGGGSGNPVVFSIDSSSGAGVCSIGSGTVSFTGAGTCVIDADQAGNADYDAAAQQQQSFTVVKPPSALISSPADGQTFALGQHVVTSFSCAEGADGPGISSCSDSNGASAPAGVLDTSKTGTFAYTVTARSEDGQSARASIHYTVAGAPSAQISSPADGATYTRGQNTAASYRCRDGASGPGIRACTGTVASGAPIDTSQPGPHTFTVTATSIDGQQRIVTVHYTVALPSNRFAVRHLEVHHNGTIEFDVTVPYAGQLDVLATSWKPSLRRAVHAMLLRPGPRRYAFARRHLKLARAGTLHLTVRPSARGRRQVRRHHRPVRINLWLTYEPARGTPANAAFTNLLVTK